MTVEEEAKSAMEETFITDSIGVVGLLLTRGWKVLDVRPGDIPNRYVFVFPEGAKDDAKEYFTGAQVEARRFQGNIQTALAMIREAKRGARR